MTIVPTIVPTILAGGSGTRLWPRSRAGLPKQFLELASPRSLLVETAARFLGDSRFAAPVLAGAAEHGFMVAQELAAADIRPQAIVAEPERRNTAPAIAAVTKVVMGLCGADAVLAILPADQLVRDPAGLRAALLAAAGAAAAGKIVTVGIAPTGPATGYGYIEMGAPLADHASVRDVARFVEKPDLDTAKEFLAEGRFLWNAGMFVARADVLLAEMRTLCPDVVAAAEAAVAKAKQTDILTLDRESFTRSPSISFDYAVMEKTARAAVVPADIGWTDVGSWSALWEVAGQDKDGNALKGDVLVHDCRNSLIESDNGLVVGLGLENMLVVHTRDAALVAPLSRAQEVGKIVETLKAAGRAETQLHTKVYRPWGWYDSLWSAPGYQVKHLMIAPGAAISLQRHRHRSEHWVVQKGMAKVTCNDAVFTLQPGQSTVIPVTAMHRLENLGKDELHVIEVQLGDYLGEDDIERFEDRYNRV